MTYKTLNNLTGWAVFSVALITYLLTMAPTASFWDCAEFIACSNELEVTHPPGAPLFLLLGRIMSIMAGGDVTLVARMVNLLSVFSGAFTAMLVCWTVTMLVQRAGEDRGERGAGYDIAALAAGLVAGLTCTFADSVWFNAVEAEVYGMSSLFTALVVWLMFKWQSRADQPGHLRWLILIAYLMGLSIGVHLLNLLTIPALALVFYFRKFRFTWLGLLTTLGISVAILGFIQYGIIQYSFKLAWVFEKWFTGTVNRNGEVLSGLGMPMGTGSLVLALLILATVAFLLWYSHQRKKVALNTATLAILVIGIGFSSYTMILLRSRVNPPIDMNNPENILTFLSYMGREQYGDRPLFRGPLYSGQVERDQMGRPKTRVTGKKYLVLEGADRYVEDADKIEYVYRPEDVVLFPRMYESSRYNSGPFGYKRFVRNKGNNAQSPFDDKPTRGEDFQFFWKYQLGHMYGRYFMWNFVGRESDIQDAPWQSGFESTEKEAMPFSRQDNKARNHFYFLPLFFGLLGLAWHYIHDRRNAVVITLLFFFTGVAIVLYLNQYPAQPRERDYSYAGSFQTFAFWVGMGVMFIYELLRKYLNRGAAIGAGLLGLVAPLLMGFQGWDDHTRRGRWVDIEFAKNLLDSCAPNAILFTAGDNDTFSVWYVQEVEGYRTDVRIANLELLISDWYIDQMKQPQNGTPPLPISMQRADYAGETTQVIQNYPARQIVLPVDVPALLARGVIDSAEARMADSLMAWEMKPRGGGGNPYILRKDSVIIDILRNVAEDGWQRPVYFANTMAATNWLNLDDWLRMEGLAYRVLPVPRTEETVNDIYYGRIDQEIMKRNMMEHFHYQGLNDSSVNFDEHIRQVIISNYRNAFFRLANSYFNQIMRYQAQSAPDSLVFTAQSHIEEIMAFSFEKIPHKVVPRNLTQLVTGAQLLQQAGIDGLAREEYLRMKEVAMTNLQADRVARRPIDQNNLALRCCVIAIRYFASRGEIETAREVARVIDEATGQPLGSSFLEDVQQ